MAADPSVSSDLIAAAHRTRRRPARGHGAAPQNRRLQPTPEDGTWTASSIMRAVFAATLHQLVAALHDTDAEACWPCPRCGALEAWAVSVNVWRCNGCRQRGTAVDLAVAAAVDPDAVARLEARP